MSIAAADRAAPMRYPPYSSRPAAQSASLAPLTSTPRPGTGSTIGNNDAQTVDGPDKYLPEIEITMADRQEGYDADLVNLPERNTAAAAAAAAARAARPSSDRPPGSEALFAATLPYASRTLQNGGSSLEPYRQDDSHDDQRFRGGGDASRNPHRLGIRHHSSTAKGDHHRSSPCRGEGTGRHRVGAPPNRRASRRRKKHRTLAWWERPRFLVVALVLIVAVGLGVGLGVGLSQARKNNDKRNQVQSGASTGIAPPWRPSQSGESSAVPVSVSAQEVVPKLATESFAPTASTARPTPGLPFTVDLSRRSARYSRP